MESRRKTDEVSKPVRHQFLAWFSYGTIAVAALMVIMATIWMLNPGVPIKFSPKPFGVVGSKVVKQGGVISYDYDYTKYTDIMPTVSKQFVDGLVFQSDSKVTTLYQGSGHVHSEVPIPLTLPPGVYKLRITAVYQMNPLRAVSIINETEEFTVIAADPHPDKEEDLQDGT